MPTPSPGTALLGKCGLSSKNALSAATTMSHMRRYSEWIVAGAIGSTDQDRGHVEKSKNRARYPVQHGLPLPGVPRRPEFRLRSDRRVIKDPVVAGENHHFVGLITRDGVPYIFCNLDSGAFIGGEKAINNASFVGPGRRWLGAGLAPMDSEDAVGGPVEQPPDWKHRRELLNFCHRSPSTSTRTAAVWLGDHSRRGVSDRARHL